MFVQSVVSHPWTSIDFVTFDHVLSSDVSLFKSLWPESLLHRATSSTVALQSPPFFLERPLHRSVRHQGTTHDRFQTRQTMIAGRLGVLHNCYLYRNIDLVHPGPQTTQKIQMPKTITQGAVTQQNKASNFRKVNLTFPRYSDGLLPNSFKLVFSSRSAYETSAQRQPSEICTYLSPYEVFSTYFLNSVKKIYI